MAITDVEKSAIDFMRWHSVAKMNGIPNTWYNERIHPYEVNNPIAVPKSTSFKTVPFPKATAVQILENNTGVQQSQTVKFSEKVSETTSSSTTEGYKVSAGIKSTTKLSFKMSFIASGGIEQTVEVSTNAEYNHSSTTTTSSTVEKTWEVTQPVIVPANSRVTATLIIMGGEVKVPIKLSANITGSNTSYHFCSHAFARYNAVNLGAYYRSGHLMGLPNRPASFKSIGPNYSLNVEGASTTVVSPGLYTTVRFDQTPLSGYSGETKTWYSNQIMLRDGHVLTIPNFDPFSEIPETCNDEIEIVEINTNEQLPIL
ncbi:pesticidal protein [Bacillus wiedmannii]|uniref:Pesticidal protein n=2 Tax=Bacillus wiedmannii TaxID=1890302 RepID=A0A4U2MYW6_9BACI|nr:ETX/MTX2 family pore-forming toxin [Bacillus wiedmannii]TKH16338.1 pesticidal protein [Bacillus wiedmannii]